jgi:hypothetical protein
MSRQRRRDAARKALELIGPGVGAGAGTRAVEKNELWHAPVPFVDLLNNRF